MDPSIVKLLEEDDEVKSMHSESDLDTLQAVLSRDIEGVNHYSSQQFATGNNGDANANLHRQDVFESTQDHRQPGKLWEDPCHVPQSGELKSRSNHVGNEPDMPQPQYMKLQKMSSQQVHGVEQLVDSVNLGLTQAKICDFLRILIDSSQHDKDKEMHYLSMYYKVKRKETTTEEFVQHLKDRLDDQVTKSIISMFHKDQSVGQAQKPLSLVQQGVTNVPLKQNNALTSRSDDDLEKQSSKMVLSTSITSASSVSPSMTTQLDSSTVVNLPAASGTFPAGPKVRTTSKMPSVGRKKHLEELGSSLPPSRKKQKLCETSSDQSIEKFNDVTAASGINLREEENQLLFSGRKKSGRVSKASQKVVHEEEERTLLQRLPLQRMLTDIMAKSGIKHIDHDVERCLSVCVEERMRGLLFNAIRVSKHRIDAEKCRNPTFVTSDIRKQISEMNQKVKEELEKKHAGVEKVKNEENDTEKEDKRSQQLKAKKDADERRAKAANVAVHAAVGGDATFLKWKLMAEARQKLSSGPGKNSMKLSGETGGTENGKNHRLSEVVRSISGKDVIAVVEKEPQMRRSTLLYRLYNRICSDV